ncbi:hypothetical protein MCEMSE15_00885 [Fimbriimonadaceae bacterium]
MKIAVLAGVLFGISGVCQADCSTPGLLEGEATFSHRTNAPQAMQIVDKFEAKNENVREVLRSLFKKMGVVGYTIHPDVQGNVTLSLSQVPLNIALESLMRQVDASYLVDSGIYMVEREQTSEAERLFYREGAGVIGFRGPREGGSVFDLSRLKSNRSPVQRAPNEDPIGDKMISTSTNEGEDIRDFLYRMFSEANVSFALSPKIEGKAYCQFNSMKLKDVLAVLGEVHGFHAELRAGCYVLQPTLQVAMNLAPSKSSRILVLDGGTVELMAPPRASTAGKLPAKRLRSVPVADEITALFRQMNAKYRISPNLPKISGNLPSESKASRLYRLKNLANVSVKLENGVNVVRPK